MNNYKEKLEIISGVVVTLFNLGIVDLGHCLQLHRDLMRYWEKEIYGVTEGVKWTYEQISTRRQ